jgi:hypothetical protein
MNNKIILILAILLVLNFNCIAQLKLIIFNTETEQTLEEINGNDTLECIVYKHYLYLKLNGNLQETYTIKKIVEFTDKYEYYLSDVKNNTHYLQVLLKENQLYLYSGTAPILFVYEGDENHLKYKSCLTINSNYYDWEGLKKYGK